MKINERVSKFKITSVDGNTLVISEEGIIPTRGLRAKMKVIDDWSGNIDDEDNIRSILDNLLDRQEKYKEKIEQQNKQSKMDKLEELCRPISDYLKENYCPYDSVVITDDKIRLVRDEIGIPVERDSEVEDELDNLYNKLFKELSEDVCSESGLNITLC